MSRKRNACEDSSVQTARSRRRLVHHQTLQADHGDFESHGREILFLRVLLRPNRALNAALGLRWHVTGVLNGWSRIAERLRESGSSVAAARSTRTAASPLQQIPKTFGAVNLQVCGIITKMSCFARQIFNPLGMVSVAPALRRTSTVDSTATTTDELVGTPYSKACNNTMKAVI